MKYRESIDFVYYMLLRSLRSLFFCLPRRLCLLLGEGVGALLFRLDGRHRRIALINLEKALGSSLSAAERRCIARKSFAHFGRVLADDLKWAHLRQDAKRKLLHVEGKENVRRALEQGNGALLFSAHFGNWEVASLALSQLGPLSVVARPLDSPSAEKEIIRFRAGLGAKIIYKQQAAKPVLQALRRNEMVAILIDQNVLRTQAVFVDFFGLPAATTPSLASFHLRTRAPVIPVFCYPASSLSYQVKVSPPLEFTLSGDWQEDVLKITRHCTKIIEAEVRRRPELWFWFHNRWKTGPEGETSATANQGSREKEAGGKG